MRIQIAFRADTHGANADDDWQFHTALYQRPHNDATRGDMDDVMRVDGETGYVGACAQRVVAGDQEGEFKITKDVIQMRIPDGDHKMRGYQVVSIKPIDHSDALRSKLQQVREALAERLRPANRANLGYKAVLADGHCFP